MNIQTLEKEYKEFQGMKKDCPKLPEAATKSLKAAGYEARTWYHAD